MNDKGEYSAELSRILLTLTHAKCLKSGRVFTTDSEDLRETDRQPEHLHIPSITKNYTRSLLNPHL